MCRCASVMGGPCGVAAPTLNGPISSGPISPASRIALTNARKSCGVGSGIVERAPPQHRGSLIPPFALTRGLLHCRILRKELVELAPLRLFGRFGFGP